MASISWKTGNSGSWQTGSNWSNGVGPGTTDTALLTANGNYTVTSTAFVEVGNLQLGKGATLNISAGSFELDTGSGLGTVTNAGTVIVGDANQLTLAGTVSNTGTIQESSAGSTTEIRLNASVALSGGGKLTLSDNANNYIFGNASTFVLTNVDNTISGAGQIGDGQMTLVNQSKGVIDATGTNALIINTGANVVVNSGLLEDTGKGGLVIAGSTVIDGSSGGSISAAGAGATVQLDGATIRGGTLKTSGGGVIETTGGTDTFDGSVSAVNNTGQVMVANGTDLFLSGTINNTGSISLNSTGSTTEINLNDNYPVTTLTGGGSVVLSASADNYILGSTADQLINANNTISGGGQLGDGSLQMTNQAAGVVDANQSATALVLNLPLFINQGLAEATAGGNLSINSSGVLNAGGSILSSGANSVVDLSSSYIGGGTLTSSGGGLVQTVSGVSTLDGATAGTLTTSGTFLINNATDITLLGTINNTGTIQESSTGSTTEIQLDSLIVTLQGKGSVTLSDNASNYIFAVGSNISNSFDTLNNVDDTISGAGQIGDGQMQLSNSGTIRATGTNALDINLGNGSGVNGAGGFMIGAGTGGLIFQGGVFSNNGTIEAINNSSVTFNSAAFNLNAINGTLTGGTWEAVASGKGATLSITGGAVVTDAATIILSGAGSVFQAGNGSSFSTLETSLTTIAAGGTLSLKGSRGFTTSNALTDSGTISQVGGTLQAASLTVAATGLISGSGTVKGSVTDSGTVTASGGLSDITGNLSGSGKGTVATRSTLEVDGRSTVASISFTTGGTAEVFAVKLPANLTSTISNFGTGTAIDLLNTGVTKLSYASTGTNQGTLTVSAGTSTVATIKLLGSYTTANFTFASDGNNGTDITFVASALRRSAARDLTSVGGWDHQKAEIGYVPTLTSFGGPSSYTAAAEGLVAHAFHFG